MTIRSALAALAIAALACLSFPPAPAAACTLSGCSDYGAPIPYYGPQGPEAFQDLGTGLYTFTDGSTSSVYQPPSWSPAPTFWDSLQRTIFVITNLFAPAPPSFGASGVRG